MTSKLRSTFCLCLTLGFLAPAPSASATEFRANDYSAKGDGAPVSPEHGLPHLLNITIVAVKDSNKATGLPAK
jgi:hypothetical protein